jgi:hypothetical protein
MRDPQFKIPLGIFGVDSLRVTTGPATRSGTGPGIGPGIGVDSGRADTVDSSIAMIVSAFMIALGFGLYRLWALFFGTLPAKSRYKYTFHHRDQMTISFWRF